MLKRVFLSNTWADQQYQYLKHGSDNPVALQMKKLRWGRLSQISRGKLSQVVCVRARARVCVCVCGCVWVLQHHSCIHHKSPKTMHLYVYI